MPLNSPLAAPCNVTRSSVIMILNSPGGSTYNVAGGSGMTCHGIRPKSAILEFYIWFRVWPYHRSRCHSVASLRNLIQIRPPSAEKMTSCRFSRWRISAILGSLKSPCTTSYRHIVNRDYSSKLLSFWENRVFANWRQTDRQQTNKQTDEQMDRPDAWSRSLNKLLHAILA